MQKKWQKLLQDNLKFILLGLILVIIFRSYVIRILLFIALGMLGVLTLQMTRFVPDVSFETITAGAVLLGYLYGWKFAAVFALFWGIYGFIKISKLNQISITMILFMLVSAVLADIFAHLGYQFWLTYILTFILRGILSYPVMQLVNPNVLKNVVHAVGDTIFNIAVAIHIFNLLFELLQALNLR
jgi:hypothetical protein